MTTLELGAGHSPSGADVTHDRVKHAPHIDVAHDLNQTPWPFEDEQFDEIYAMDVFEHLQIPVQEWLDECWRILKPNGLLKMRLAAWDNEASYRDPTHERVFTENTFDYWDPYKELYEFGRYYFMESNKWWRVVDVFRHLDAGKSIGDIRFDLEKRT